MRKGSRDFNEGIEKCSWYLSSSIAEFQDYMEKSQRNADARAGEIGLKQVVWSGPLCNNTASEGNFRRGGGILEGNFQIWMLGEGSSLRLIFLERYKLQAILLARPRAVGPKVSSIGSAKCMCVCVCVCECVRVCVCVCVCVSVPFIIYHLI